MMLMGLCTALALTLAGNLGNAETLRGEVQKMGAGTLRSYVDIGSDGRPTAIGALLSEAAFSGLPPLKNATSRCFDTNKNGKIDGTSECEGDLEFQMALPAAAIKRGDIPFRWIGINWNAEGHPPAVWSVPHFDFHFYMASRNEVALIRIGACKFFINCNDFRTATTDVPAKYVAPGHVNVKVAVGKMGNHMIDVTTPELAKPPKRGFTHTWVYGSYNGQVTFYEPMITLAYFLSRPNGCTPIRQPKAWAKAGYYPTEYCIRYANGRAAYTVSLEGLVKRAAE